MHLFIRESTCYSPSKQSCITSCSTIHLTSMLLWQPWLNVLASRTRTLSRGHAKLRRTAYKSRHDAPLANSPALPPVAQVTHTHRPPHTRALTLFICPVVGEWRESWSPVSSLSLGLSLVTPPMVTSEVTVLVMAKLAVTGLQSILLPFCSSVATTTQARQVCDQQNVVLKQEVICWCAWSSKVIVPLSSNKTLMKVTSPPHTP